MKSILLLFLVLFSTSYYASAQSRTVTGKVTDSKGETLPGVSVKLKGTSVGATSGTDGRYTINVSGNNSILVVTYIGFVTQEVAVNNQTSLDIALVSDVQGLEEVVVVGYGTQKKVNLTGSVASVSSEQLEKRAVTKSSLALQGQMSGIQVRQGGGNPASNGASLVIRGQGTFSGAGNNPLVLVDGIEASLDLVDPNDIQSVSILKDAASAAIFGSKAANGVILVETKKGIVGKPVFTYNSYIGKSEATMVPEMINSWEYAEVINQVFADAGAAKRYSDADIEKFKSGTDPVNFPNFDHIGNLFNSGNGISTRHDMSVRGGSEQTQYMFSLGYYNENGIITKNDANRYNIRMNLDSRLNSKLKFSLKMAGNLNKNTQPSGINGLGLGTIVGGAMRNANSIPGRMPDGFYGRNETLHPEADLESASFLQNKGTNFYTNGSVIWDIFKDLKITGQIGHTYGIGQSKAYVAKYAITSTYGNALNSLNENWSEGTALTLQTIAEYQKKLNDHSFYLLGGVSGQSFDSRGLGAFRDAFPNNSIYEIDAGSTARGRQGGSASRNTLQSYFGRFNYNFRDKYLFEANARYDGSSRFPKDSRWGLFPSFSAAWRVSQESFFKDAKDAISWLSDLKFRASWGKLGNQSIGNYPYQDLLSLAPVYPFGSALSAGAAITTIANKNITWETTTINNVGLDLGLFNDKLSLSADYFVKTTDDILYSVSVSNTLGATPSLTNAGSVENRGWDFNLNYRNVVGEFSYGVAAIFSFVHNEVTKLSKINQDIARGLFVGYPIGSAYGFKSGGLFGSNAEVAAYAKQPFADQAQGGGIKYLDISGPSGVADGVVNATYDRVIIGKPLPTSTYALTLNGGFKNFDFNFMLQGEGGRNDQVNLGQFFFPLENNSNVQRDAYENRWTAANPNPNAAYPKLRNIASGFFNTNRVDFWYRDATFLRLKNAQIGYTLPKKIISRASMSSLRLYVSGENLFTLSDFYKGWDPEMQTGGSAWYYPLSKLYVAGISLKF
ncbi:MAG: TonB-dependent receptor [Daejeonella sp.]|nr:TonB-dependent receptor [Daejeonella sp.]